MASTIRGMAEADAGSAGVPGELAMIRATATFRPRSDLGRFVEITIKPAVRAGVEEVTKAVFDRSQELVPVLTGALKASGHQEVEEVGKTIRGVVSYDAPYAGYVCFGTGIAGASSEGAGPYPYNPQWPGMPAQPFQRPAMDELKPRARDIIASHVEIVL